MLQLLRLHSLPFKSGCLGFEAVGFGAFVSIVLGIKYISDSCLEVHIRHLFTQYAVDSVVVEKTENFVISWVCSCTI